MVVDVPVGGRHRGGCALKQGESERLEEEYDRQLGERLGQEEEEEEEEGDRYHPTRRHGGAGGSGLGALCRPCGTCCWQWQR